MLTREDNVRTGKTIPDLKQAILDNLYYEQGRIPELATKYDWYMATALAVRDRMMHDWIVSFSQVRRPEQKVVAYPAARSVSEAIELARHECQAERAAYNAFVADIYAKHGANKLLTSLRAVQASIVRWKDEERQMMTVRVVAKSGKPPVGPIPWADAAKVDVGNDEFRVVKQPKPVPKKMPRYIPSTPEEAEARRKAGLDPVPDKSNCWSA